MALLLRPWRQPASLVRALAYVVLAVPMSAIGFTLVVTGLSVGASLIPLALVGFPLAAAALVAVRHFADVERRRTEAFDGRPIATTPTVQLAGRFAWVRSTLGSSARWREAGYAAMLIFPATILGSIVLALWAGSLALLALPITARTFPDRTAHFHLFDLVGGKLWFAPGIGALGLLLIAPWATVGAARGLAAMARNRLGPAVADLADRVVRAESVRAAAVDSAEAERRRIERDLHDGAQQRLVALAAGLGSARERMDSDPAGARELVVAAHEDAKGALRELRDLVRGINPVILTDRGLDAALSAIVARCPVPVDLRVEMGDASSAPLPAEVDSAAYFVVSEALTNVARHAGATRAAVHIARSGGWLVIEVRDDGVGGADPSAGTGLRGLKDRVTALHGNLVVLSPPGGPTTVSAELPCGS